MRTSKISHAYTWFLLLWAKTERADTGRCEGSGIENLLFAVRNCHIENRRLSHVSRSAHHWFPEQLKIWARTSDSLDTSSRRFSWHSRLLVQFPPSPIWLKILLGQEPCLTCFQLYLQHLTQNTILLKYVLKPTTSHIIIISQVSAFTLTVQQSLFCRVSKVDFSKHKADHTTLLKGPSDIHLYWT